MQRRPPGSPLFPYTTLFRSSREAARAWSQRGEPAERGEAGGRRRGMIGASGAGAGGGASFRTSPWMRDRKSTRLNSSHANISYAVFCLKKKTNRGDIRESCI